MGLSHVCPVRSPYPLPHTQPESSCTHFAHLVILEACTYFFVHSMLYTVAMQQCGGRATLYHFLPLDRESKLLHMYHTAEMHLLLPLTECKTPDPVPLQPGKMLLGSSRQKHWFLKVRCDWKMNKFKDRVPGMVQPLFRVLKVTMIEGQVFNLWATFLAPRGPGFNQQSTQEEISGQPSLLEA